jgi:chromosome segregation ATPase
MPDGETIPYNKNGQQQNTQFITTIAAFLSLFASVGLALWTNAKGDVTSVKAELREDIRRAEERMDTLIGVLRGDIAVIRSNQEDKMLSKAEHKEFVTRVDGMLAQIRDDIKLIRADLVPRSEHAQHWADVTDRLNALRIALEQERQERVAVYADFRKEFGSTYTAGDQMKNLQDQIKLLSGRLDALSMSHNNSNNSPSLPLSVPITPGTIQGSR